MKKTRHVWLCTCKAGYCDFATKREAMAESGMSKFCLSVLSLKRVTADEFAEIKKGAR